MSDELQQRWSDKSDRVLRAAGWYPGRAVATEEWERILHEHGSFEIHEAAQRFLTEFGGLAFDNQGQAATTARAPFRLDPLAAEWDDEIYDVLSEEAGAYLYPIGEADRRNSYLGISPSGAVYWGRENVALLADTADEALEKLIMGKR